MEILLYTTLALTTLSIYISWYTFQEHRFSRQGVSFLIGVLEEMTPLKSDDNSIGIMLNTLEHSLIRDLKTYISNAQMYLRLPIGTSIGNLIMLFYPIAPELTTGWLWYIMLTGLFFANIATLIMWRGVYQHKSLVYGVCDAHHTYLTNQKEIIKIGGDLRASFEKLLKAVEEDIDDSDEQR